MDDSLTPDTLLSSGTQAVTSTRVVKAMPGPQTHQTSFPILKLPLEIRDLIYGFALTSSALRTQLYHHWFMPSAKPKGSKKRVCPSLNLLLANQQIYSEASRVLHYEGCFVIPAFVHNLYTLRCFTPSLDQQHHQDSTTLDDKWYRNIRNIELEIGDYNVCIPVEGRNFEYGRVGGSFEFLEPYLARFPRLKAITVVWQSYTQRTPEPEVPNRIYLYLHPAPQLPRNRAFVLAMMRDLRSFEMSHPTVKITVQIPAKRLTFKKKTRRQTPDMGLGEFMAELKDGY